jgi:hypothetical protein
MIPLEIIKASYGDRDCTKQIIEKIQNNKLVIRSDNSICGDPNVGVVKYLKIEAKINGIPKYVEIKEGDYVSLPESTTNRLGIFYSNNINQNIYPAIRESLKSIQKAAANKVDIYTCMWREEPENPFYQCIAWTQTSSHLNQILQILQLLYTAKKLGNYKYVSFLEHDVLYAEEYFDYPDFTEDVIVNMNYIGMNKDGYQNRKQNDKPTSQLIMTFEYAIEHFQSLLPNAVVTNSGLLEPQCQIKEWNSKYPNVHINHGVHFTSHFTIYDRLNTYTEHPYWGDHSKYLHLFI